MHDSRMAEVGKFESAEPVRLSATGGGAIQELVKADANRVVLRVSVDINSAAPTSNMRTVIGIAKDGTIFALAVIQGTEAGVVLTFEECGDLLRQAISVKVTNAGDIVHAVSVRWRPEGQ